MKLDDMPKNLKHVDMLAANRLLEPDYDPDKLLNTIIKRFELKNDAALSRALKVQPPVISKYRHRRLAMSDAFLVRVHDVFGIAIRDLRTLLGVKSMIEPYNKG